MSKTKSYRIDPSDQDIDNARNLAAEQEEKGGSQWPGMSYEQGVAAAIGWMLGDYPNPMDDQ